jgi:hypothetical protein
MTDDNVIRVAPRHQDRALLSALRLASRRERHRHHDIPHPGATDTGRRTNEDHRDPEGSPGFDGGGEGPAGEIWLGRVQVGRGHAEAVGGSVNPPIITKEITEAPA